MNDKTLLALALAKTLYSEKRNYLDTFTPFVIRGLDSQSFTTLNELEEYLKSRYSLRIPLNTIQSIIRRLERRGFVKVKGQGPNNLAVISEEKATEFVEEANKESEKISRKQNKLVKKLREYFKGELGIDFTKEQVEEKLKIYVLENIAKLALSNGNPGFNYDIQSPVNKGITSFLVEVDHQEQELYESFNDLLRGAVLWQTIAQKEDLDSEGSIEKVTVYLDTNMILSLLGLHHEAINRAASQMLKLLHSDNNLFIRVFDKTIEEVIDLLASYKYNKDDYGSQRVNHVYFFLKMQGYDNADIDLLIRQLEDKLNELEVYKEELGYDEPSDLPSRERKLYETLYTRNREYESSKDKDYQKSEKAIHNSTFHDVAILSRIREARNGWQASFERCKSIFVTNSYRLYSFSDRNKLNNEAVPEVITDIALTNILWLKNPGKDVGISIDNILEVHSSDFLVDNQIWRKFLNTLHRMHEKGEIDEREYALLTSNNQLTDQYLLTKDEDDISPDSVQELNEDLKLEEKKKEEEIQRLKQNENEKEQELEYAQNANKELEREKEGLKEDFDDLQRDHEKLRSRFHQSEINRFFQESFEKRVKDIRWKTIKGIGFAILVIGLIYMVVGVMKLVPYLAGDEIWGFNISQPSFEGAFTTVLGLLFIIGQTWWKSYRDSDWSVRDSYWSLFDKDSLKQEYHEHFMKEAESKFGQIQGSQSK